MGTFFNQLRINHPNYAEIALHIFNEGKKTPQQVEREKLVGMIPGASDIIIPGNPTFICEMKSQSPQAKIYQEQIDFLIAAQNNGAFVCIALGYEAAIKAFLDWKLMIG